MKQQEKIQCHFQPFNREINFMSYQAKNKLSDIHHGNFHAIKFQEINNTFNEYIHCKHHFINSLLFYSQSTVPHKTNLNHNKKEKVMQKNK